MMKVRRIVLVACLALCFTTLAVAQKQEPPKGGTPKDLVIPPKEIYVLDNGLDVTLIPYGTIPKTTITLIVRAGNVDEEPNEIWIADLLGNFLKEGTSTLSAEDLALKAAAMGGSLNVSVGSNQTSVSLEVLSEFTTPAIELLGDVVQNPLFPESELERLKSDLLRNLSIQQSDPGSIALAEFRKVLYPDHPYGRVFPTEEMIQSFDIGKARKFFDSHFGALRSDLYVAGIFEPSSVKKAVDQAFGSWTGGTVRDPSKPEPVTGRAVYLVDRPGAHQSNLMIGLPVVDPSHSDYLPLNVTNFVLGGFFSSRITRNIREDKGYTYSPYSQISSRFRDAYWVETANVATEVTGLAIQEILNEIEGLGKEAPSEEELKGVQNYMNGSFVRQNASKSGIIGQLSFVRLHGLDESYLRDYVKNVLAVTPDLVKQMAEKYIRSRDLAIVVVGDKAKILNQIREFGEIIE
jgi:predicted Zn-dependent peptidase